MGESTGIIWCDRTSSPWHGCTKVSPGCDHCYAAAGAVRNPKTLGVWGQEGKRVPSKSNEAKLRRWNEDAKKAGLPLKVFPSICDPFEDFPRLDELRAPWFKVLRETPHLTHLLLTKRPHNVLRMVPPSWLSCAGANWPRNVWIGTTVEDQQRAEERMPALLRIPCDVRFVSVEPQIEEVDLKNWLYSNAVHWVIQGCESGAHARAFDMKWARLLRNQCFVAGVPYFLKQIPNPADKRHPITDFTKFPVGFQFQEVQHG